MAEKRRIAIVTKNTRPQSEDPLWYLPVQASLFVAAVAGAIFHAFPYVTKEEHQNVPNLDLVTIAWLGLALVALIIPEIAEVSFGELSVKLGRLKSATADLEVSFESVANLVQNWSTSSVLLMSAMLADRADVPEPKSKTYSDYVRDRMGEAYELLAIDPKDNLRIALWLYKPATNKIEFAWGFRMSPTRRAWDLGEGMIGKAFVENRHFNEADVRMVPSYMGTRDGVDPPYRAVLCEPVRWGGLPIGMITVDRASPGFFDGFAIEITQALCAQCALATTSYAKFGGD